MTRIDASEFPKGTLAAAGQVALVAASADGGDGNGGNANRKMRITAYNGGLMDVGWRQKVGVELAGLTWREDGAIPILCLHDAHSLDAICGIYQLERITIGSKSYVDNTMRNLLEPVSSPYLSGTAYWLFNSAFPLVDVAFLNGMQAPVIETANADFSQLGIEMRCYFDYGASAGEVKAALYSTGA